MKYDLTKTSDQERLKIDLKELQVLFNGRPTKIPAINFAELGDKLKATLEYIAILEDDIDGLESQT